MVYLCGGNDALSTVVPYQDPFYYSRRPAIAIPAGQVLQIGSDSSGKALGLHPRLTGLRDIFNEGRLAIVQRTGYANSSRSHFQGTDIWGTADPASPTGAGLARTLPRHAAVAGRCARRAGTRRARRRARLSARTVARAGDSRCARPTPVEPEQRAPKRSNERDAATRMASYAPPIARISRS